MNRLLAGFARVNMTPPYGARIDGYFKERQVKGVLDELEANALALRAGDRTAVMIAMDACVPETAFLQRAAKEISQALGIPVEAVYIHATHTHTGGDIDELKSEKEGIFAEYPQSYLYGLHLLTRLKDVATAAVADLKSARMGFGIGQAPNVAFVRRFRMKDGSVRTNPGVGNPDIVHPIGDVDERVNVIRFDQEGGKSIVLANFGNHPDVVGGELISADWPGFCRRTVEKVLDNTVCLFFNGAQGDVNHVNVHPTGGFLNDTFHDFDDVSRGYGHARYIGRVVAGGVLQAYDKVEYVDVESISYAQKIAMAKSAMPTPEELVEAEKINALHEAGRDDELPYEGMTLTTVVAEAGRMVRLKNGPEAFPLLLSALRVGPVAFAGIPGEPFTGIGRALKETEGFSLVCPTCITNASAGYFPMAECYEEGGYEARSANYKSGVAEFIIEEMQSLLKTL